MDEMKSGGSNLVVFGDGTLGLEKGLSWAAHGTAFLGAAEEALAGLGGTMRPATSGAAIPRLIGTKEAQDLVGILELVN